MSNNTTNPSALVLAARAARVAHLQGVAFIAGVTIFCIGYFVALCFII
jgi:uncharacterized ion transporter superfamily protein YfcC